MPFDVAAHPLAIAPMIQWTNTYFRRLMRLIAPQALVYTEMVALPAMFHGQNRCLDFDHMEHPIALQVGGSDRAGLVEAVKMAESYQFDEINLNLGCPSPRVQKGRFGACLMREGAHVADCIQAMKAAAQRIPVTVKMRIGVDELDSYDFFHTLAGQLIEAGVDKLIIHARKAWLKGLSPKQNRTIPPLQYAYVTQLKAAYPQVPMVLNGQLNDLALVQQYQHLDGVMIGRLACDQPYALSVIHRWLHPDTPLLSRTEVIRQYVESVVGAHAAPLSVLCRPLLNMAHGLPRAKAWKAAVMGIERHQNLLDLGSTYDSLFCVEDSE